MSLQTHNDDVNCCIAEPEPKCRRRKRESATETLPAELRELAIVVLELPFTENLIVSKAKRLTRHPGFSETDDEDIAQALRLAVYQGCLRYSRRKGAIESFVTTIVKNQIFELVRHREAKKRSPKNEAGSLNRMIESSDGLVQWIDMFDINGQARPSGGQRRGDSDQVALSHDIETVLGMLNAETREVARLLMHHSPAEIEKQLGMTRGKIRGHISLIREHFEEHDLRDYLGI